MSRISDLAKIAQELVEAQQFTKADIVLCAVGMEYMKNPADLEHKYRHFIQVDLAERIEYETLDEDREREYGNNTLANEIRRGIRPLYVALGISIARSVNAGV